MDSREKMIRQVEQLVAEKKHAQARQVLNEWLKNNTRDINAMVTLAKICQPSMAIQVLNQVLKLNPNHAEAKNLLARNQIKLTEQKEKTSTASSLKQIQELMDAEQKKEAKEKLEVVLKERPDDVNAKLMYVKLLGASETSIKILNEILAKRPDHPQANLWLKKIQEHRTTQELKALQASATASSLNPTTNNPVQDKPSENEVTPNAEIEETNPSQSKRPSRTIDKEQIDILAGKARDIAGKGAGQVGKKVNQFRQSEKVKEFETKGAEHAQKGLSWAKDKVTTVWRSTPVQNFRHDIVDLGTVSVNNLRTEVKRVRESDAPRQVLVTDFKAFAKTKWFYLALSIISGLFAAFMWNNTFTWHYSNYTVGGGFAVTFSAALIGAGSALITLWKIGKNARRVMFLFFTTFILTLLSQIRIVALSNILYFSGVPLELLNTQIVHVIAIIGAVVFFVRAVSASLKQSPDTPKPMSSITIDSTKSIDETAHKRNIQIAQEAFINKQETKPNILSRLAHTPYKNIAMGAGGFAVLVIGGILIGALVSNQGGSTSINSVIASNNSSNNNLSLSDVSSLENIQPERSNLYSNEKENQLELLALGGTATSALYSPDGRTLVIVSSIGSRLYDANQLTKEPQLVTDLPIVAFSPDGSRIVTSDNDNLYVWDFASGNFLFGLLGNKIAFSSDGTRIATGGIDALRIWNASSGELLLPIERSLNSPMGRIFSVDFHPDGKRILVVRDGGISVWDTVSGEQLGEGINLPDSSYAAYSPDGKRILAEGGGVAVWENSNNRLLSVSDRLFDLIGVNPVYSPDGKHIVTFSFASDKDDDVLVWDATNGKLLLTLQGHTHNVRFATYSPDGAHIISIGDDTIRVWDANSGAQKATIDGYESVDGTLSIFYSQDGTRIVSSGDDAARVWDAITGNLLFKTPQRSYVAISRDGTRLVTRSIDAENMQMWDTTNSQVTHTFANATIEGICEFSPNERYILALSDFGWSVQLWDITSGKPFISFPIRGGTGCPHYSPDGTRIVYTAETGYVEVRDTSTGDVLVSPNIHGIKSLFGPDGKQVLSASGNKVIVWETMSGEILLTLDADACCEIMDLAFSPDGSKIVISSSDEVVRVWDAVSGTLLMDLQDFGFAFDIGFSADGIYIGATTNDQVFRLLDTTTYSPLLTLQGVIAFSFSPDGKRLVTSGTDGLKVMDISQLN